MSGAFHMPITSPVDTAVIDVKILPVNLQHLSFSVANWGLLSKKRVSPKSGDLYNNEKTLAGNIVTVSDIVTFKDGRVFGKLELFGCQRPDKTTQKIVLLKSEDGLKYDFFKEALNAGVNMVLLPEKRKDSITSTFVNPHQVLSVDKSPVSLFSNKNDIVLNFINGNGLRVDEDTFLAQNNKPSMDSDLIVRQQLLAARDSTEKPSSIASHPDQTTEAGSPQLAALTAKNKAQGHSRAKRCLPHFSLRQRRCRLHRPGL